MTRLYLIRHGEAEGNLYRRMQGNYDAPLTALGQKQAEAVGRRFADIPLKAVYSSDLARARDTALAVCRVKGLSLQTDRRLRELDMGPWEDQPFGTVCRNQPREFYSFICDPDRWRLEGAETFRQAADRGAQAVREIVRRHQGGSAAICAHGCIMMGILCELVYGYENCLQAGHSDNTGVTLLTEENGVFRVEFRHDASHLSEGLRRQRWKPENGMADLHFAPMGNEVEQYIRCRKDAWQLIYGSLKGFSGPEFWMDAQRTIGPDPMAMVVGYLDRTPVGMIQLSPDRDAKKGVGYIPFIYLREEFRHKGLGIQLIGHADSFYRKLGRTKLQLSVAHTNQNAIAFYEKFGFRPVGKNKGRFGYLILMEKNIEGV